MDFRYQEFNSVLPSAKISFWLNTKRGNKIYSQEFASLCQASRRDYEHYPRIVYHKLRELLIMLDRQIETGYLAELMGDYFGWDIKQRKLTKNTWITDKRVN